MLQGVLERSRGILEVSSGPWVPQNAHICGGICEVFGIPQAGLLFCVFFLCCYPQNVVGSILRVSLVPKLVLECSEVAFEKEMRP